MLTAAERFERTLAALGRVVVGLRGEVHDLRAQVQALHEAHDRRYVDAVTVARMLGVSRDYVYAHAQELGGQRLGNGPRPRWRFDRDVALAQASALGYVNGSIPQTEDAQW